MRKIGEIQRPLLCLHKRVAEITHPSPVCRSEYVPLSRMSTVLLKNSDLAWRVDAPALSETEGTWTKCG